MAAFARKGSYLHRKAGTLSIASMLVMALFVADLAVVIPDQIVNVFISTFGRVPVSARPALPDTGARALPTAQKEDCCRAGQRKLTPSVRFDIFRTMKSMVVIESLAALAQESRLAIFRILVKRGPEGYTPSQLSDKLNVSSPTLSFHLKELQRAGLIDVRREGRFLYYRPNFAHMNQLIGFLTENCCVLADQACGPECAPAAAEASHAKRQRA